MKTKHIALTLYTLRDHSLDENNFISTLKLVGKIGYKSVQISGIKIKQLTAEAGSNELVLSQFFLKQQRFRSTVRDVKQRKTMIHLSFPIHCEVI